MEHLFGLPPRHFSVRIVAVDIDTDTARLATITASRYLTVTLQAQVMIQHEKTK